MISYQDVHFHGCKDEIGNTENCANKDSCICHITTYWLFVVIPSGQEGGNYHFELIPRSFDKVEAAN